MASSQSSDLIPLIETEAHAVDLVLGHDLKKSPIQEARKRDDLLCQRAEIARVLNIWCQRSFFRTRQLGRQLAVHSLTSYRYYAYEMKVLLETRSRLETLTEPTKADASLPQEKTLDRWAVKLPPAKGYVEDSGEATRVPGTKQVVACVPCAGLGKITCPRCKGKGAVSREPAEAAIGTTPTANGGPARPTTPPSSPASVNRPVAPATPPRPPVNAAVRPPEAAPRPATAAPPRPATPPVPAQPRLVPCSDCNGTGFKPCTSCTGTGALLQEKVINWRRRPMTLSVTDELRVRIPRDLTTVLTYCTPRLIYEEECQGGFRPEWHNVPELADMIDDAKKRLDSDTRVVSAQVKISFIPYNEVLFDLGEEAAASTNTTPGQETLPAMRTYGMYIYGFEQLITNDWRFFNWARVGVVLLGGIALVLAALLTLAILYR